MKQNKQRDYIHTFGHACSNLYSGISNGSAGGNTVSLKMNNWMIVFSYFSQGSKYFEFYEIIWKIIFKEVTKEGHKNVLNNIGLESLQNSKTECVKCQRLIISTEYIERNFSSFAILSERAFFDIIITFRVNSIF